MTNLRNWLGVWGIIGYVVAAFWLLMLRFSDVYTAYVIYMFPGSLFTIDLGVPPAPSDVAFVVVLGLTLNVALYTLAGAILWLPLCGLRRLRQSLKRQSLTDGKET